VYTEKHLSSPLHPSHSDASMKGMYGAPWHASIQQGLVERGFHPNNLYSTAVVGVQIHQHEGVPRVRVLRRPAPSGTVIACVIHIYKFISFTPMFLN
jgi:hypothetical protein